MDNQLHDIDAGELLSVTGGLGHTMDCHCYAEEEVYQFTVAMVAKITKAVEDAVKKSKKKS